MGCVAARALRMIIVQGNRMGEISLVRDPETDTFSHFRYVISRLDEERPALLDGVARDFEAAKKAVRAALDGFDGLK